MTIIHLSLDGACEADVRDAVDALRNALGYHRIAFGPVVPDRWDRGGGRYGALGTLALGDGLLEPPPPPPVAQRPRRRRWRAVEAVQTATDDDDPGLRVAPL